MGYTHADGFVVDGLPAVWYVLTESDPRPRFVGGAVAEVLGDDAASGDTLVRYVHPDDRGRVFAARLAALYGHTSARMEYRVQRPGSPASRWVLDLMNPVSSSYGLQLSGVVIDTTAEHRAFEWVDRSLHEAQDALAHLTRRNEAKGTFIRLLLHDVRPVLDSCRWGMSQLEHGDVTPASVRSVQAALTELVDLVEGVIDLDRLQDDTEVQQRTVDLADLARSCVDAHPSASLQSHLDPARTIGDPFLLERVVDNLVRNAFVHTPPGTVVLVRTWVDEGQAFLEVADQGPGIPPELGDDIFEPFVRVPSSDRPGVGMGLALVRRVVAMHGGRCTVQPTPGGGATFVLGLPGTPEVPPDPQTNGHVVHSAVHNEG